MTTKKRDEDDDDHTEAQLLRATALQNIEAVQRIRLRVEQELLQTKEKLEEETRILELLNQTGSALASKRLDLEAIVSAVTDTATAVTGAQFGAFFYTATDAESGEVFTLYTLAGAPREMFEKLGHPRATPIFAPTFKGERIVRSRDITADPDYGKWGPHHGMPVGHLPVRSYLAVPVVSRSGQVLGGLFFGHADTDVFTDRAERLVTSIATQAAMAIDNARLYDDALRAAAERERLLTAEREARAALEQASLLKDHFLATLSHELRTPLNAILGWSELLLSRTTSGHELRSALETIARNARVQAKLVEDLLDMNLIMSGRIRLAIERVDLVAVIDGAIDTVRHSANAKSILIRKTIDPKAGPVTGDASRLQQVIWNLLSNSVKFTNKGGKIDILLQRINSHVQIVVHDTGCGISAEFIPFIFERFRQEDASATRRFGGLGLGLSIVKQLVELHGGSIRVESPGAEKGTTFFVLLPVRAVDLHTADVAAHGAKTSASSALTGDGADDSTSLSLSGIKALVVDDEPDACELLKAVLSSAAAAEVMTASSADEALALVKAHRFDIIISDIGMPDRDGNQLMRDLRALTPEQGGKTPAIAVTAFARSEDRTRSMLAGYQVHMSKPIDAIELLATIRSLVFNRG